MIQIIANDIRKYNNFSNNIFLISEIDEFQSFDNYDITVIDISDNSLWYNDAGTIQSINQYMDLQTINSAIKKSEKSNIVIVFPQNIYYHYEHNNISGGYRKSKKIKDMKKSFIDILSTNLINMNLLNLNFGKSYSKIKNFNIKADFSFLNVTEKDIRIKADNGNDIVAIQKDKVVLTTLELNTEDEFMEFLKLIFPKSFDKSTNVPDWIEYINFYTDIKCKEGIDTIEQKIKELEKSKKELEKIMLKNSEYKSILYETGDVLSKQINNMLAEIFEYDISQFKDTYEEDGLIKLEDITFIIETKGLNNEISGRNVSDASNHLIIYEDKLEEEKIIENTRCLFFVAYERNKKVEERVKIKDRLEIIAKANNTLIVDTREFLKIFEDFLNKKIDKEEVKEIFKNSIGVLEYKQK